jgi:hypothetical protein
MTSCDHPTTLSGWMANPGLCRVVIRSGTYAKSLEVTGLHLTLLTGRRRSSPTAQQRILGRGIGPGREEKKSP